MSEEKVVMKGYKAFNKGMKSKLNKQYFENTVFEEDVAEVRHCGMHFCKSPLDTLDHYPLVNDKGEITEFAEVEALDEVKTDDYKLYCTKKLKIGAKISLAGFIKASLDVTRESIIKEAEEKGGNNATLAGGDYATLAGGYKSSLAGGKCAKLAGGKWATLAGGDCATLAGGDHAKLAGGDWATLAGGDCAKLAGGDYAKLAGGDHAKLAGGDCAKLAGGDYAKLAGGDHAKLAGGSNATLAGGSNATLAGGKYAILAGDVGSIAKGKKGAVILLVERNKKGEISNFNAVQVDGEIIKEDTFYKLENGEFVEVDNKEGDGNA